MEVEESATFGRRRGIWTLMDGERGVIERCLALMHLGAGQVVRSTTQSGLRMPGDKSRMTSYLREELAGPGLREDTLADFLDRNREPHPVTPDLNPNGLLVPVEDDEFRRIFEGPGGWERFRKEYPRSDGTLRISRVGLNSDATQALFYAGQQFDWDVGSSGFWLLDRTPGDWRLAGRAGNSVI